MNILENLKITEDKNSIPDQKNVKIIAPEFYTEKEIELDLHRQIKRLGYFKEFLELEFKSLPENFAFDKNPESILDPVIKTIKNSRHPLIYFYFDVPTKDISYEYFEA